jgi:hypothetical protein
MREPPLEPITPKGSPSRWWKQPLVWSVLLSAGIIVYELTADPVLGVILVCSKFGWQDFLIAYRLWRVDPNRGRMRTMSSMHLASGFTRIGVAAAVIFYGASSICVVNGIFAPVGPVPPWQGAQFGQGLAGRVASALLTGVVVFLLAAVATGYSFWHAQRSAIKVWLGPPFVPRAPRNPALGPYPATNFAPLMLRINLVPFWLLMFEWTVLVLAVFVQVQLSPLAFVGIAIAPVPVAVTISAICYRAQRRGVLATTPAECWGTDVIGTIMCMKVPLAERTRWLASIPRKHWRSDELQSVNMLTAGRASNVSRTIGS